jgi:photosystem II stability/assembly factor-like uncharacterized protein
MSELPLTNEILALEVDPKLPGHLYLLAGADGFWRSEDGGQSWQPHAQTFIDKTLTQLAVVPEAETTLYVATPAGEVWKSTDGGITWISVKENLVATAIADLVYDRQHDGLLLGSLQGGLYRFVPGSISALWTKER